MEAARPALCPMCNELGGRTRGGLGLHGHGCREVTLLGPLERDDAPAEHELSARRYLCQHCASVIVVVPRAVWPRFRYSGVAIVRALGRWAIDSAPSAEVRREISPYRIVGDEAARGWRSLRRWARPRGPPDARPRDAAAALVRRLATRAAMPTGKLTADAASAVLEGHQL